MSATARVFWGLPVHDVVATAAVFVMTLLVVKLVMMVKKKHYNLPPGPWGLPLVGYLPFFGPQPHLTFTEMRKVYGDVISIKMGSWPAIVICGIDVIKEALVNKKDDFSGRPAFTTARLANDGRNLAFSTFGSIWKMHRMNVRKVMYTFANARDNPTEDIIRSEAKAVIEEFLSHGKNSFCPLDALHVAGGSMVYQLCFGRHQNIRDDADFMELIQISEEANALIGAGNVIDVLPWFPYIVPSTVSKLVNIIQKAAMFREKKIEEHETTFDENNLRDITDGLIHAGNRLSDNEKAVGLDKRYMNESLDPIFGAGSSTVSTTLKWCVALMVTFPEAQEEVFQQIDTVVGQSRDIALADHAQLPLVDATICEIFRYVSVLPFALPHATTCDTTLQGYDIPEGTVVLVNLYSIFADEKLWGDPNVFRPKRFLDSEGQLDTGLVEQTPAFSWGRRRCVGEFLARMELFLFFGTLMQRLKFFKPPGQPDIDLKAKYGLTQELNAFDVCVSQQE